MVGVSTVLAANQYVLAQEQPTPDNTVTQIALEADGDAVWTIRFRTELVADAEEREYEQFQQSFRANTSQYLDPFEQRMSGAVDGANDRIDREMRAVDFTARTSVQEVPRTWGVVTFEFTWEGFAATDGNRLVVSDVFAGGFYIGEGDVLEVTAPDGYAVDIASPQPDETADQRVEWNGREDFADGHPKVIIAPTSGFGSSNLGGLFLPAGLVLFVVGIGAVALRHGWGSFGESQASTAADGAADLRPPMSSETGPETDETGADSSSTDPTDDYEILTNEDQALEILQQYGGQMKQTDIVDELGWSKSKTSRVLSGMADDGTIEKLRLGRENVIRLQQDE